jgi:hypothetical protein
MVQIDQHTQAGASSLQICIWQHYNSSPTSTISCQGHDSTIIPALTVGAVSCTVTSAFASVVTCNREPFCQGFDFQVLLLALDITQID